MMLGPAPGRKNAPKNVIKASAVTSNVVEWVWEALDDDAYDSYDELSEEMEAFTAVFPTFSPGGDPLAELTAPEPPTLRREPAAGRREPAGARREAGGSGYGLAQIMTEAEGIIREAELERDRLLAAAREELTGLREEVYREAIEQARADAEAEVSERLQLSELHGSAEDLAAAARALQAVTARLEQQRGAVREEMEHELIECAFSIARKVVGDDLEEHPERVADAVREAIGRISGDEVTVRLNPADLPFVQQALGELQASRSVGTVISFEADGKVERGGCVVVGEEGTIDAQPTTKLEQLSQLL